MKDYLFDYYNESNIKSERRRHMLETLLTFVIEKGISNVSYKEMAEVLQIERRTLYDYYGSKDDIFVDIAYLANFELYRQYMDVAEILDIANETMNSKMRLKGILNGIASIINDKYTDLLNFLTEFNTFFNNLDHKSEAYIRYHSIIKGFKADHHYLAPILTQLYDEGLIKVDIELDEVIDILEQSFQAYLSRILIKQHESDRYDVSNIRGFVDILVEGVCL